MGSRTAEEARHRVLQWRDAISGDSKMYARLATSVAESDEIIELIRAVPPGQLEMNLLFAAVQWLLLAKPDQDLAEWYPSLGGRRTGAGLEAAFAEFVAANDASIRRLITTMKVQTNEVARCAFLLPAYNRIATAGGAPLAVIEVGTSAGLTQNLDRYAYKYTSDTGSMNLGGGSSVKLECETGTELPAGTSRVPPVAWRCGLDVHPIDITEPEQARWLQALVWPDQVDRHARLKAAIEIAQVHRPRVVGGEVFAILPDLVAEAPRDTTVIVQHSFVLNQLDRSSRERLFQMLDSLAATRPIYRVGAEWLDETRRTILATTIHGENRCTIELGEVHHHGRWMRLKANSEAANEKGSP